MFLDAGCGFGRLFPSYSHLANSFYLVDYAQNMLDQAKEMLSKKHNISFLQGDLTNLPIDNEVLDAAISIRTLHHIDTPSLFFEEMNRVMKPGGIFLLKSLIKGT